MFSLYSEVPAAQLRRDRPAATASGGCRRPTCFTDWDFAARNLRSARWLHRAHRRGLQRLVHVPDPARGAARRSACSLPALHQVGRLRVRPARQGGRLPDGDLPRRRRLARAVDRQERRPRLAGLLPPAQPLHRGAAALAVPARRPDGPREPQPPDQAPGLDAVLHRRAAPPGARGRARRARSGCTTSCRPSSPRSARSRKQFADAAARGRPGRRSRRYARTKPPRKGQRRRRASRAGVASWSPRRCAPLRQLRRAARRSPSEYPEAEIAAHGRQVVPHRQLRLRDRLDARRHLGGALPARPGAVPRPAEADRRDPPAAAPRVADGSPRSTARRCREITSPEAWEETFGPWLDGADDE